MKTEELQKHHQLVIEIEVILNEYKKRLYEIFED
jgi:hypothetical protein